MTIEAHLSVPQGGSECPQNNNLTSLPETQSQPISAANENNNVGTFRKVVGGDRLKTQQKGNCNSNPNSRKKVSKRKIGNSKIKTFSATALVNSTGELKDVSNNTDKIAAEDEGHQSTEVNNAPMSAVIDLKKSVKSKCSCQDEAKARKSMRLRLRKGFCDESFAKREPSPRHFENLPKYGFEYTEENKIIFLGAIGLTPQPVPNKDDAILKDVCGKCGGSRTNEIIKSQERESVIEKVVLTKQLNNEQSECFETIGLTRDCSNGIVCNQICPDSENPATDRINKVQVTGNQPNLCSSNEQEWKCWVSTLPLQLTNRTETRSAQQISPSLIEIKQHLQYLVKLGTDVKIVTTPNISI